ncbi:hypothetical protein L6164_011378 [Bauhinia variegata]|uniref:Uncharacterized protein n=1 Tax=Bauhinia variegata TaxID=167791 RepID=A0ACB9P5T9_BAUVA|nr:hypothetical protein L6164_011378 [Bauhinia variegata]
MTRPKPLPNEALSYLAVSAATMHNATVMLVNISSSLPKLLNNSKFPDKWIDCNKQLLLQGMKASCSISLITHMIQLAPIGCSSSLSTVRVDHDAAGMLAINVSTNSREATLYNLVLLVYYQMINHGNPIKTISGV